VTDDLGAEAISAAYTQEEAVALALEAGNDLLLFANQAEFVRDLAPTLIETVARLVESGRIPESRLDDAVDRLDLLSLGSAIE
jgi:beta-N-acetylhexosaminidase